MLRRLAAAFIVLALGHSASSNAADFAGGGTGPIPDNNPTGMTIGFNVSGITPSVGSVRLRLGLSHTWAGDVTATLRSPGGVAKLVILGRVGVGVGSGVGDSSDLSGVYEFSDDASLDLWAAATATGNSSPIPRGKYRASGLGVYPTRNGGCATSMAGAFNGLSGAQANGLWTLTVSDHSAGDLGSVDSALLSVSAAPDIFSAGFDPLVRGSCQKARMDFTGSGRSSYVLVRNTGGGATGAVTWMIKENDGTTTGATQSFLLGDASNTFTDLDYDGDGISDAAVWKSGAPGVFTIRRSSRPTDAPVVVNMGQTGDDPSHSGDYNGDGFDDLAVHRPGATSGQASHTYVQLTGGVLRDLITGENGAFASGGVDYTGDGRADIAIQANAGGGVASYRIYDGTTAAIVSSFNFGAPTDIIVLGNHIGNAWADLTNVRGVGGAMNWSTRDGQSGIGQPTVVLGASATDYALSGDYDGDGIDDYAVWRPSATAGQSKFIVRPSTAPATTREVFLGASGDYPVGNNRVH